MNSLAIELRTANARNITVTGNALVVDLTDGRTLSVPLAWYPRLLHGTPKERKNWRLIGDGEEMHWQDLDEDISVENIVLGKPSGESQRSFKEWLKQRATQSPRILKERSQTYARRAHESKTRS